MRPADDGEIWLQKTDGKGYVSKQNLIMSTDAGTTSDSGANVQRRATRQKAKVWVKPCEETDQPLGWGGERE